MGKKFKTVVPTPGLQAKFCKMIYEGAESAVKAFEEDGFRLQWCDYPDVKDLPFHMYVPNYFPDSRDAVEDGYDWAQVPKNLAIGFVARGTKVSNMNNVETCLELLQRMIDCEEKPVDLAQLNCSHIIIRLNEFLQNFPEIKENKIQVNVYIAGHSLGGFLAAAITVGLKHWVDHTKSKIVCTTFESPGLTKYYQTVAEVQMALKDWKGTITNYVGFPNFINTAHRHLGKIIFLNSVDFPTKVSWASQCIFYSALRWIFWMYIASLTGIARKNEWEVVAAAVNRLFSAIRAHGTKTIFGYIVDMKRKDLLDQHGMARIVDCFMKVESGLPLPHVGQEMECWPSHESIGTSLWDWLKQGAKSAVPLHPDNTGIHNLFNRKKVIMRRLKKMKGFVPVVEKQ